MLPSPSARLRPRRFTGAAAVGDTSGCVLIIVCPIVVGTHGTRLRAPCRVGDRSPCPVDERRLPFVAAAMVRNKTKERKKSAAMAARRLLAAMAGPSRARLWRARQGGPGRRWVLRRLAVGANRPSGSPLLEEDVLVPADLTTPRAAGPLRPAQSRTAGPHRIPTAGWMADDVPDLLDSARTDVEDCCHGQSITCPER